MLRTALMLTAVLGLTTTLSRADDSEWARFRGPNGQGTSNLKGLPTQWKAEAYEWTIELPDIGHSSPAISGEFLFLTTGTNEGGRTLHCIHALTGEKLWSDSIKLDPNHLHKKNSYASGTPAVDGERVFVAYADERQYAVLAYNLKGERLWSRDLGSFTSQHGQGVSPIVYQGKVIVPNDQRGPSQIVALNAETGETTWSADRKYQTASYATPMIISVDGRDQLICLSGAVGLAGLDPQTGEELWSSGQLPERTVASPVYGGGLLFATCGSGGRGKFMIAVDPHNGGKVKAERTQNLPYVPTPIYHDGHLYLWNDDGVVCCVSLAGDLPANVWRERVGGNYSGSPVLIDGKIYCISEDGEVVVIAASPQFELLGKSPLGDASYATPAVANGRLYLRGFRTLTALKATSDTTGGP